MVGREGGRKEGRKEGRNGGVGRGGCARRSLSRGRGSRWRGPRFRDRENPLLWRAGSGWWGMWGEGGRLSGIELIFNGLGEGESDIPRLVRLMSRSASGMCGSPKVSI